MDYEDPYQDIDDLEEIEVEPELKPLWQRVLVRVFQIVIGLAVIAGLIYLSGFRQFFFYRKTSENIEARQMESVLRAEELQLPISARIMKSESGSKGSTRDREDIERLITESNKIWNQADIELVLKEVEVLTMKQDKLENFAQSPREYTSKIKNFNPEMVNTFFIGNLEGPSGLAYMGSDNILVADYTTSHDYLVFAHEVGHVLGLGHVSGSNRLMSSEANGAELTKREIKKARRTAKQIEK